VRSCWSHSIILKRDASIRSNTIKEISGLAILYLLGFSHVQYIRLAMLKICVCAKSLCGGATDNNVHATTAIEIRCNINSDSCSNFNFSNYSQIIKKRTITALNFWRRRENT
jgi:hypothetical protein